jgi:hypothetical protein
MQNQLCKQCGTEFQVRRHWQLFCTARCRDAWHYVHWKREQRNQQKLAEAQADLAAKMQLPELRKKSDVGMQIVEALKYRQAQQPAWNGFRRRQLG